MAKTAELSTGKYEMIKAMAKQKAPKTLIAQYVFGSHSKSDNKARGYIEKVSDEIASKHHKRTNAG